MRYYAFTAALAALLAGPAAAQPSAATIRVPTRLTAKELRTICRRDERGCLDYVLGAVDSFVATSVVNSGRTDLCFPPSTTNAQIAGVAIAYIRAHPQAEEEDRNAAIMVLQGIRAAFPCR